MTAVTCHNDAVRSEGRRVQLRIAQLLVVLAVAATGAVVGSAAGAAPVPDDAPTDGALRALLADQHARGRPGPGWVRATLGCADSTSADDLHAFFADRRGPLIGWDNPHVIELGPNRWLWLAHDTYLDYPGTAATLHDVGGQIQNVAFVQVGSCFYLEHRGTKSERVNFEPGDDRVSPDHFLWPLGSEIHDGRLMVFWGETANAEEIPPVGHGISRHPIATWLATYDVATLERLSFEPAPNPGVEPQYGFAVASDETHSYLFGNTNLLNFWRSGGILNGPHSATKMYIARVPRGRLDMLPEYWNGGGWTGDASLAVPFSERFFAENAMQPRYLDGQWVSVVNMDGFYSWDVLVETADDPWGPWVLQEVVKKPPRAATAEKNTYHPIILPWSSSHGGLTIAISENAAVWAEAVHEPPAYRPGVFRVEWPGESEPHVAAGIDHRWRRVQFST